MSTKMHSLTFVREFRQHTNVNELTFVNVRKCLLTFVVKFVFTSSLTYTFGLFSNSYEGEV